MKRRTFITRTGLAAAGTGLSFSGSLGAENKSSASPVIFTPPSLLEAARKRLGTPGKERWDAAWKHTYTHAAANLETSPHPYQGPLYQRYYDIGIKQAAIARDSALVFALTGDERFLNKAGEFLMAYARDGESNRDPARERKRTDQAMVIARVMTTFCYAYSLVHSALGEGERSTIETWMANLVPPIREGHRSWIDNDYFGKQLYQNHLGAHMLGMTAIGAILGDRKLVDYALQDDANPRNYERLIEGAILMRGDALNHRDPTLTKQASAVQDGEIYDRYRSTEKKGFGYAMLQQRELALTAEIATNNGLTVHGTPAYFVEGTRGRRLEMTFNFYADFLITGDATIQGGYYAGEKLHDINVQIYEMVRRHFPANEKIREVVTKAKPVVYDPETFGATATVTHGESALAAG